jgi:hypothetical protein
MSKPSDAAIAMAFWEARRQQDAMPITLVDWHDVKVIRFGNDIVARARILDHGTKLAAGREP